MGPSRREWFAASALLGALAPAARAQAPAGKKVALLVGVKSYDSARLSSLRYTENDVERLADLLRTPDLGFADVRVLTTTRGGADAPTAANIRAAVKELFSGKSRHDTILFGFAGHGVQLTVTGTEGPRTFPCLCPADSQLIGMDYKTGESPTLINFDHLLNELGGCGAGAKLLLIDACRNEVQARNVDVGLVRIPSNTLALFSCEVNQRAYETSKLGGGHGVFFHHVLEGLRGKARNDRGEVSWSNLSDYVTERVSKDVPNVIGGGAEQTPHEIKNRPGTSPVLRAGTGGPGPPATGPAWWQDERLPYVLGGVAVAAVVALGGLLLLRRRPASAPRPQALPPREPAPKATTAPKPTPAPQPLGEPGTADRVVSGAMFAGSFVIAAVLIALAYGWAERYLFYNHFYFEPKAGWIPRQGEPIVPQQEIGKAYWNAPAEESDAVERARYDAYRRMAAGDSLFRQSSLHVVHLGLGVVLTVVMLIAAARQQSGKDAGAALFGCVPLSFLVLWLLMVVGWLVGLLWPSATFAQHTFKGWLGLSVPAAALAWGIAYMDPMHIFRRRP